MPAWPGFLFSPFPTLGIHGNVCDCVQVHEPAYRDSIVSSRARPRQMSQTVRVHTYVGSPFTFASSNCDFVRQGDQQGFFFLSMESDFDFFQHY